MLIIQRQKKLTKKEEIDDSLGGCINLENLNEYMTLIKKYEMKDII